MNKYLTITLLVGLSLTAQMYGAEPYRTPSPEPRDRQDARLARVTEQLRRERLAIRRLSPEDRRRIREESAARRQAEENRRIQESFRRAAFRRRRREYKRKQRALEAIPTGYGSGKRIYGLPPAEEN